MEIQPREVSFTLFANCKNPVHSIFPATASHTEASETAPTAIIKSGAQNIDISLVTEEPQMGKVVKILGWQHQVIQQTGILMSHK